MSTASTKFKRKYGPWALIAGASEGLGAAYADELARRGLDVLLIARTKSKLQKVAEAIRTAHGVQVEYVAMDLMDTDLLLSRINELHQDIGLLIYNAAYAPIGPFVASTSEDLQRIHTTNVLTPMLLVHSFSQRLLSSKRTGGIVLMSSLAGNQGTPLLSGYAASKAFNTILAEGLWLELKDHSIDVISSIAGAIRTPGYHDLQKEREAFGTLDSEEVVIKTLDHLGKSGSIVPGVPNKIAMFVMTRLLPRSIAIKLMHQNTKKLL